MIFYQLSYKSALSHFVDISLTISGNTQKELYLQLPAWRPGRYELQHFAQKLNQVTATAHGATIATRKITKDRWQVETDGAETITINYSFYARQMDAGGSWLDEQMLYLNPINCLMAVEGRQHEPCEVTVTIPENWQIACGLPEVRKHTLQAANYDELVDGPFIASGSLQHASYSLAGTTFHIWIQGDCKPDWSKIIHDFEAFTKAQLEVFCDFPVPEYHYLNLILPYRTYHGVEHSHSTVITLGPGELLMSPALYKEFIGVSSHELFHTWNIKKIRPKEMLPYNLAQENYFKTGYVAEGITTYYGDYMLARSGVFTAKQYFDELSTTLQRYFADYSRHHMSVADSSFDLWLDGYKPGIPDRKVSIYIKGALTALLLDLKLRKETNNRANLDAVMRELWIRFGQQTIGYTEQDYADLVDEIAGQSFRSYFDNYINGTAPIEPVLDEALNYVGCTLKSNENTLLYESRFGFKVSADQTIKVTAIAPASPAYNSLSIDDELVALNGRKLEQNLQHLLQQLAPTETITLTLFREKQLQQVMLIPASHTFYPKYSIEKRPDATTIEKQNFKLWLHQEFEA
ncbi:M61 family metallopeptidase [Pontibacter sp. BT310]|uniref:PDZ domain-containing protein n=1 Tax=Pontibacter populi TaxID=890055 RepID=A0ABS6XG95_9BACT|nr:MULTISPECIES: PDZ domain-containing protein [Pontibacter]MBJ6119816.1 M61 family metallopeptidase [Pontibacter sp. BT310]MBR0572245.1 M61 family metallopeptidase [Microvirga sp. STS03]MBW3366669.1 PDZ domain-containing protein [Pontibacter populi]